MQVRRDTSGGRFNYAVKSILRRQVEQAKAALERFKGVKLVRSYRQGDYPDIEEVKRAGGISVFSKPFANRC